MNKAKITIAQKIEIGQTFELKDLFPQYEWNTLSAAEKRGFGRYFSNEVNEHRVHDVIRFGSTKSRHNQYIKTEVKK